MSKLLERYTSAQRSIIEAYWETIRFTRSTGKLSEGIKDREYAYWDKYKPSLVTRALSIHMEQYPNVKENYTRGILRNLQKGSAAHAKPERNHALVVRTGTSHQGQGQKRDANAEEAFRRRLADL